MTERKQKSKGTAKKVFKTPERECSHADRGCCARCLDPATTRPTAFRRVIFSKPRSAK